MFNWLELMGANTWQRHLIMGIFALLGLLMILWGIIAKDKQKSKEQEPVQLIMPDKVITIKHSLWQTIGEWWRNN
jgi:uncharacterized membrane protein YecN with MAPEG domain